MRASLKVAFRHWLLAPHPLSTTGLTTVACRALETFPCRVARPLLQMPDLFSPVVSSDLRLKVPLPHLPASPKTPSFKSSPGSATSIKLVFLHCKLGRSSQHRLAMLGSAPRP